jgi:hypothetical protein
MKAFDRHFTRVVFGKKDSRFLSAFNALKLMARTVAIFTDDTDF